MSPMADSRQSENRDHPSDPTPGVSTTPPCFVYGSYHRPISLTDLRRTVSVYRTLEKVLCKWSASVGQRGL